ncbi:MAG: hypothetical protein AAGJ31_04845 [Verrucomicrobiota bacterium]
MNDANESPPPSSDAGSEENHSSSQPGAEQPFDLRSAVTDAWKSGADDARQSVEDTFDDARSTAKDAAQRLAYGLGYGATFINEVLDTLVPEEYNESAEQGRTAGQRAASDVLRKIKTVVPPAPSPSDPDPSPER